MLTRKANPVTCGRSVTRRTPRACLGCPEGFTLVEVLVVLGTIAVLLGLLLAALRSLAGASRQTVELSATKQLMTGYLNYAAVHSDALLPGYGDWVPYRDGQTPSRLLRAYDRSGTEIAGGILDTARKRYVWRLAPYLSYNLRGLYANQHQELLEDLEGQDYAQYLYKASLVPSLGLNSEWVGGDSGPDAYGFEPPASPLRTAIDYNRFYITATGQGRTTDKLLVFASARGLDPNIAGSAAVEGYYKVRSPYFTAAQPCRWSEQFQANEPPLNHGFISPRYDGRACIGFLDGHTGLLNTEQLRDMRHWANWATTDDWRLPVTLP